MKKCLVVALSCLVSFAARADMTVDITVERAGQPAETRSFAMNEVATFNEAGVAAELTATQQDGAVCITAKCCRVTEAGQEICGEIPSLLLAFDEVVTLVKTEEVTVTIVARSTDVKAVDCSEEAATQEASGEEAVTPDETTKTAPEEMMVEVLVVEEVVTETTA